MAMSLALDEPPRRLPAEVDEQWGLIVESVDRRWAATPEAIEARSKERAWLKAMQRVADRFPDEADEAPIPPADCEELRRLAAEAEEAKVLALAVRQRMLMSRRLAYAERMRGLLSMGNWQ